MPPHFAVTFDKSTVNRCLNQAVIILVMVNGERIGWYIDAPLIYSVEKGHNELSGGETASLAHQIRETLSSLNTATTRFIARQVK